MTLTDYTGEQWTCQLIAVCFGLVLGSFFNVVICRLPGGARSFFIPAVSQCPVCCNRVRWYDNIPLLSYAILGGKCRNCGTTISLQYPLVESLAAVMVWWLYYNHSFYIYFYVHLVFFSLLLCMSVIDLKHRRIPNELLVIGMVAGVVFSLFTPFPGWKNSLAGLVLGYCVPLVLFTLYELLRGKTLIGGGDIKLLGMIGATIGWQPMGSVLFYSGLAGLLVAVVYKVRGRELQLPFVPFLTFGTFFTLYGPDISKYL